MLARRDGDVIRTDDGGATWNTVYYNLLEGGKGGDLGGFYFFNASTWFTFPSQVGTFWGRTFDAGKHWETFENPTCPRVTPFFLTSDVGWGVSESSICGTKDGGKTWSVVQHLSSARGVISTIFMLDDTHGWIGRGGEILATTNGSRWFTQFQDPNISSVEEIHFFDRNNGYASVGVIHQGGTIIYSRDGGQHWQRSTWNGPVAAAAWLLPTAAHGDRNIWVIQRSKSATTIRGAAPKETQLLFHSADGGESFSSVGNLPEDAWSLAVAAQQRKPVLLVLDPKGALWRAFLSAN